ncbi:hypothetical protein P618_200286 [Holospora obtusa F1]|uniref:Uncharacterized protein n=1 Tax=Holospora obtusa F1 TaxID=1399147 RepID=W6THT4_HOLOB|nr:hypothetical protein P618_200286 [Holospora obtusa F1]
MSMGQGSFQATEFRSGVSLFAAQKLQLLAAPVQDSYHKTQVLKKNIARIKTQSLAGQGLSYRNCGFKGRITVDTPLLEMSAQGSPPALEIAPRESFCQVLQVLEPCIQEATHISTQFKPAFKAVLGVGITALSAVLAPPLVGSVIAASGHAFIQNSGLECLADHRHIHFREMLKDAGKSLAVSGAGLALGEILPDHRAIHAVKNTALNCAVYQADPLKALAGQGLIQASGFLAGQIGLEYQSKEINFLEHKLLHGALSLASTLSLQAVNSGHLDWSRAFLAAGTTMAAESGAELVMENVKQFLPKQLPQEPWSDYVSRCQEAGLELGRRTQACIRVLTAAGLCLAGKDSGDIIACDTASSNALEHNFLASIPAIVLDVVQGAKDIKENLEAGNYWTAGGHAALTAGSVALDLASSGLGTQGLKAGARAAKAGVRLAKKAFSKEQKGPNTLMKTGEKTGGGTEQLKGTQKRKDPDMTPEEMRRYFEQYKDDPVPVGKYKDEDFKKIVDRRAQETGLPFEQHHVWPVAQAEEIFKVTGRKYKNNTVVPLPRKIHQAEVRKLIHKRNEQKPKPQHPRESLLQGIQDTRNGLLEAGCDRTKTNEACLQALRKIKSDNPGGFDGKIPPKSKGDSK